MFGHKTAVSFYGSSTVGAGTRAGGVSMLNLRNGIVAFVAGIALAVILHTHFVATWSRSYAPYPWPGYAKSYNPKPFFSNLPRSLTVINAFGSGAIPANSQIGQPYGFLDTAGGINDVGDDFIAPADALAVINAINAGLGGEGESVSASVNAAASGVNSPQVPAA